MTSARELFPSMPTKVPVGEIGSARVDHFEVTKEQSEFTRLRAMKPGGRFEFVPPGIYARLWVNKAVMMTDTPMERFTNMEVVRRATGHVFIAGLGLGMILWPILEKKEVTQVTVLEKNPDVYDLILPHVPDDPRLGVVEGDVFTWEPPKGTKFDAVYFDIWADQSTDTLDEMAKLHRRFARRKTPGAWMGSWKRDWLLSLKRSERRDPYRGMVKCGTFYG